MAVLASPTEREMLSEPAGVVSPTHLLPGTLPTMRQMLSEPVTINVCHQAFVACPTS